MREFLALMLFVLVSGCVSGDDSLYAPWNEVNNVASNDRSGSLFKIVNNKLPHREYDVEYCVTKLTHPYNQTCTKELNL